MLGKQEILSTIRMFEEENLDVRTVTLGINLAGCSAGNLTDTCQRIRQRILHYAESLSDVCTEISDKYGIPIVNRRLAVSPIGSITGPLSTEEFLTVAQTLDETAATAGVDLAGGFSVLAHKGATPTETALINSLPVVLPQTNRLCASVSVASSKAGINMDVIGQLGRVIREIAAEDRENGGFSCAKLCIFSNMPEDNPFMAGACHGFGEAEAVINIGVSGPGVVKQAIERFRQRQPDADLGDLANAIKQTAFRVTRVGELVGREVAEKLGVPFGVLDLSLAPTPKAGDSVGEILQMMGISHIGAPGSTAAVAMLNDAVKKGGLFASTSVGGLSGAFIPVAEDRELAAAVEAGSLSLEKLEAMTAVCSVGLDMVCIPGDTSAATIAGIIADEMAIGMVSGKTTAARLIPVPGKKPGDWVHWGGLFGASPILNVRASGGGDDFIRLGGRIPAPLQSFRN